MEIVEVFEYYYFILVYFIFKNEIEENLKIHIWIWCDFEEDSICTLT